MSRRAPVIALLACFGAAPLAAQDSQFSVQGLGTPARQESVRARATAGAFTLFDAPSPRTEAALADLAGGVFGAQTHGTRRTVEYAGGETHSLTDSRFPVLFAGSRTPWGIRVAGGFATFLERSFVVQRRDSVVLRGEVQPYTDEHLSEGSVTDLRIAVAGRPVRALAIGAAFHVLTGSTQEEVRRRWDDSVTYRNTFELQNVRYNGLGVSVSALLTVTPGLRVAGWLRTDNELNTRFQGRTVARSDLPLQAGGAVEWRVRGSLRVAGAARWAGWSGAPAGHDTFGWSLGAELGGSNLPLRVGVRRDQMAFGPGSDAPTELGIAAGFGRRFSDDRARIDFALERMARSGQGLDERLWTVHVGLTVRP